MRFLFLLGILVLKVAVLTAQSPSNTVSFQTTNSPVQEITRGAARFSGRLTQEVARDHRRNLVASPLGASLALSMASFGARTFTEALFLDALGLPLDVEDRKIGLETVIDRLNSHTAVELDVVNGAFVSSKIHLNPEFIETTTETFGSPVQKIDFSKSVQASDIINAWCSNKTRSHIQSIMNPDDLSESTGLVLVNAVYFKGGWLKKFDVRDTFETPFVFENGTTKPMLSMHAVHVLRYGEVPEVNANFVELPYQNDDDDHRLSMFIILPEQFDGLAYIEENFHQISIRNLLKRGQNRRVNIQLPKFTIQSEIQLKEPLTRMNMGNLFDRFAADFTGIVKSPRLVIDKIVQKAFIDVNEEGSEAAAASAAVFGLRMNRGPRYLDFRVDHPFYAIIATTDENPLNIFTARFTGQE